MSEPYAMWRCPVANCGYVYDPDRGDRKGRIAKGTAFDSLPQTWTCPVCGCGKNKFVRMAEPPV